MLDLVVAIPTLIGSMLSMFAAGFVLVCYIILPTQRHFRHTLIINLALADFINATNNTVSGIYAISQGSIPPGTGCALNGLIGQVTVQATDFSIFFIAITTLVTLRKSNYTPPVARSRKILATIGIWFVPSITAMTALALDAYQPVSGNWCWIRADKPALRYGLGHAWRLTIIFSTITIYAYLSIYLHNHFSSLRKTCITPTMPATMKHWSDPIEIENAHANADDGIYCHQEFEICEELLDSPLAKIEDNSEDREKHAVHIHSQPVLATTPTTPKNDTEIPPRPLSPLKAIKQVLHAGTKPKSATCVTPLLTRDPLAIVRRQNISTRTTNITGGSPQKPTLESINAQQLFVFKLLLLNAYPIGYVLLWIPGIANRFFELSGHKSHFLAVLQASTQLVGLVNAIVYVYNERIWDRWCARRDDQDAREDELEVEVPERREVVGQGEVTIGWPIL